MQTEPPAGGYAAAGTSTFYDSYGDLEWQRLEARAYGRLQAIIHAGFLAQYLLPGQRVLDAGCGPGRFTIQLARLGARPLAFDTSPQQLAAARQRCEEAGVVGNVEAFVQGDIVDLSAFADASFDAVVCFGGPLSYVRDRRHQAAAELVRVTRAGGYVLVSVMSRLGTACNVARRPTGEGIRHPLAAQVWSLLEDGDLSVVPSRRTGELHPPMHLYTSSELASLFESCTIVAMAGSNVTAVEGDPAFEEAVAADPAAWPTVVALEQRLSCEPGLVDTGSHIILVAQRP